MVCPLRIGESSLKKLILFAHFQSQSLTYEYFPYFDNTYVAVAASLNGGNCLAAFVKMIQDWVVDLGLSINQSKIWEKTIKLGQSVPYDDKLMTIQPTLFGERHKPELKGSIGEIMTNNLTIGQVNKYIYIPKTRFSELLNLMNKLQLTFSNFTLYPDSI